MDITLDILGYTLDILGLDILGLDILELDILGLDILGYTHNNFTYLWAASIQTQCRLYKCV